MIGEDFHRADRPIICHQGVQADGFAFHHLRTLGRMTNGYLGCSIILDPVLPNRRCGVAMHIGRVEGDGNIFSIRGHIIDNCALKFFLPSARRVDHHPVHIQLYRLNATFVDRAPSNLDTLTGIQCRSLYGLGDRCQRRGLIACNRQHHAGFRSLLALCIGCPCPHHQLVAGIGKRQAGQCQCVFDLYRRQCNQRVVGP